jgi:serine/threonine-protein kinase
LFLGDTDFQTVKRVQAAQVPSISQINKKVPADLERIINRSLARDPAQRYPTARALGQDLSKFLFKYGVAVSTFDISQLVQGAMKERARARPQQASIIDKLIEEALFEFTSLTDDKGGGPDGAKPVSLDGGALGAKPKPGAPGYVDIGSWLDEIKVGPKPEDTLRASLPPSLSEGNLASLEEDEMPEPAISAGRLPSPVPSTPQLSPQYSETPMPPAPSSSARELATASATPSMPPPNKKSGGGAAIGVVVALVVAAAAGAAAWFTHLIPHN